ncbi:MAG: L,D-transpeptidase family protein [Pseudomonadota bacterium]
MRLLVATLAWLIIALPVQSVAAPQSLAPEAAENTLFNLLKEVANGSDDSAMDMAARLTQDYPNFQLAQLIYGDMLAARGMDSTRFNDQGEAAFDKLRNEAHARWTYKPWQGEDLIAANLIKLADDYRYALVFDLENARLFVFENIDGTPRLHGHYYTSIGKAGIGKLLEGDNKTPLGVYRITSHIKDEQLPELYGAGAYPINYPNSWDKLHGRTGYGIWLHGVPRATYSRAPLDSEGCMVVSNINLTEIGDKIDLSRTPVILARSIEWTTAKDLSEQSASFSAQFEQWRRDWSSLNVDAYLAHYSGEFYTTKHNFDSWSQHKRLVAQGKSFIDVEADDVDIFRYPDPQRDDELVVVQFVQRYSSNNFNSTSRKQQFWRKESDGQWRIVYEGA